MGTFESPFPFLLPCHFQSSEVLDIWVAYSANVFHLAQLSTSGIDIQGCEANFSILPKDKWSSTELDTRLRFLPPCAHGAGFAVVAGKSQGTAVARDGASAFLHGWMPTANPWQCLTAINSGSTAIMVHFISPESPSIVSCYKYKDLIS